MQAISTILSISRSVVLALLKRKNLGWGAGTSVYPFLAGARGGVNGCRFDVSGGKLA